MRRLALLTLLSPYLISGVSKLFNFADAQAEVRALAGLEPAALFAAAVILVQLGGSILLLVGGRRAAVGGMVLAGFTLVATLLAHAWWHIPSGPARDHAFNGFWEHIALVGALMFAALVEGMVERE
jgi:uncharacterized membrane protein YphA (DoxX/SURF4 family)